MKYPYRFILLVLISISSTGCSQKLPGDLPKLHPCTIEVVTRGTGKPIEQVSVSLCPTDGAQKWASVALTDASGKAVLKTNGSYAGVATGHYKVLVSKTEMYLPPGKKETVDRDGASHGSVERRIIPEQYELLDKTPLECTVEEKKEEQSFRFEVPVAK